MLLKILSGISIVVLATSITCDRSTVSYDDYWKLKIEFDFLKKMFKTLEDEIFSLRRDNDFLKNFASIWFWRTKYDSIFFFSTKGIFLYAMQEAIDRVRKEQAQNKHYYRVTDPSEKHSTSSSTSITLFASDILNNLIRGYDNIKLAKNYYFTYDEPFDMTYFLANQSIAESFRQCVWILLSPNVHLNDLMVARKFRQYYNGIPDKPKIGTFCYNLLVTYETVPDIVHHLQYQAIDFDLTPYELVDRLNKCIIFKDNKELFEPVKAVIYAVSSCCNLKISPETCEDIPLLQALGLNDVPPVVSAHGNTDRSVGGQGIER